jgi:hypothetical protein
MTEQKFIELANKYLTVLESYQLDKEGNKQFNIFGYKQLYEAINYSPCCTELKGKKKPTFEEWMKKCGMQKVGNRIILKNNNQVSLGFMLEIYSGQINSGLL